MALISNHEGSSKKVRKILNNEDRISILSDSLLVHVLSFLPTKYAVGTSILSSRWKHLWASVPTLDFNDNLRFKDIPYSYENSSNFMNFVDRVLLHHDLSYVQKFRLSCEGSKVDVSRMYTWISVAVTRGVQELDLQIGPPGFDLPERLYSFPLSLFTCPTLVVLKLGILVRFSVPCSVHFKSLKVLHLSVWLMGNDLMKNLFCNCPVLEELFIQAMVSCEEEAALGVILDVSTSSLTSFKMMGKKLCSMHQFSSLKDDYLSYYVLNNLTSLVKADVNIGECCIQTMEIEERSDSVFEVLKQISSVKYLSLGASTMGVLDYAKEYNVPRFPNLIRLELHVNTCYGWKRLLDLLNSMPNLLYLVLEKSKNCSSRRHVSFVEQEVVPSCLVMHLQEIKINGFQGLSDELKLIEYFLRNSKVLRKMEINNFNAEEKQEREFLDKLLMFPRGSMTCKILITGRKILLQPRHLYHHSWWSSHTRT
ncbi:F-box/FBD/LRR-repeat protein At5g22660-like [Cornus florida]|uniref:F-box/FBD/LRR-repeat protein At5g22660-like n=1 Tax=Cornus florida TaxID=4283 RepID=UPI00289CD78B|nr:F-box/FBD/LRR-repeat protein At5g22660-like [Cornus florida]